jgi:hypothetical protein
MDFCGRCNGPIESYTWEYLPGLSTAKYHRECAVKEWTDRTRIRRSRRLRFWRRLLRAANWLCNH